MSIRRSARPNSSGCRLFSAKHLVTPRARTELGENTEMILTELLGYSWDDVAKLRDGGVIQRIQLRSRITETQLTSGEV